MEKIELSLVTLLEFLLSIWCNFSNLLKRKQSSKKTSIVYRRRSWIYNACV